MEHKLVVLPHSGPIYPKGGINGPILTPYREDVKTIGLLLMRGYKVTEVLPGDVRVELNLSNFDKENGAGQAEAERQAAERAQREAEQKAAEEAARQEAERQAAEQAQREAEQKAAEEAEKAEAEKAQLKVEKPQHQKNQHKNNHKQQPQVDAVSKK